MREAGGLYRIYYYYGGETSRSNSDCGVTGGTIVFNPFGGAINSFGGSGISIFGTKRVNGFAQPVTNIKERAIRYFIVLLLSSMASLECQEV